jgi:phosphoglycolate phosphatase/pyrophosphatase PpaX
MTVDIKEDYVMPLKYKCLILDHDDTVVDSTPHIHYPSFVEAIGKLRPNSEPLSLNEFISYSFNPGFSELCSDIMQLNEEEIEFQYQHWKSVTKLKIPEFYPGIVDLLTEYKNLGGIITVVSHSEIEQIERDYKTKCGFTPDMIFGWDSDANKRKPSPYPILEIIKRFNLKESEVLVVDDLKPGWVMAKSCHVAFAGVGWSHSIDEIVNFMRNNADYYFSSIESFRDFILI